MVMTRLGTDPDGRPVIRKEADAAGADALRREAAVLAAARHPGVVEIGAVEALDGDGVAVVLRWAGARTAADLRPTADGAARVVAALAATVADLHALGIRHGRIRPEHVVLDEGGRPVLCGFSAAAMGDEPGPTAADDVAGVGSVLRSLVGSDAQIEPIPEHRFGRRRSWPGMTARALLNLADQATADDPSHRPTARALAASIAAHVEVEAIAVGNRQLLPRLRWRPVAAIVGGGLLLWGAASVLRAPSSPAALPTTLTTTTTAARVDGGVVEVDGTRYAVGRPGDVLAVGDWDCDGVDTVAVIRPSTGEVFVFDEWATPGVEVVVPAVARVQDAARAEQGDGCTLVVVDDAGGRTEVPA